MSKIFNVTLDYLLNDEGTQTPEPAAEQGIYVSREMADGFLLYQKRKYLKIAIAIGVMVGSLALSFMLSDISMLLFMLILIAGIVLLLSVKLTDNPYRKLWKEPLLFDKTVKAELNTVYAEKKKFLQLFNLIGIALIALGFLFFPLIVPAELLFADWCYVKKKYKLKVNFFRITLAILYSLFCHMCQLISIFLFIFIWRQVSAMTVYPDSIIERLYILKDQFICMPVIEYFKAV